MRFLIFNWRDIKNPKSGGAEVLTHQMAKRWAEKGHRIVIFSSFFKGAKREEVLDNVKIIRAGNSLSVYWQAYRYYKRFFKGKFDIIIDEINTIPFFTTLYVKEPLIAHINQLAKEVWFYESCLPLAMLGYLIEPLILKLYRSRPVITISRSTKEDLLRLGFKKERIFVIPMGIGFEPLEVLAEKEKEPTLIYVGRLKKSKRVHHIIKAFRLIKERIPFCKLWIVGNGDPRYKKGLYQMAKGLDNIEFFHNISDKDKLDLMKRAHAIIVTSVREGWGLIVTEANAMGTPAIGYKVAGLKDSIEEGVNGLFTEENNSYALSQTIIEFLKNKKLQTTISKSSLNSSKRYDWDKTATKFLEVISQISSSKFN